MSLFHWDETPHRLITPPTSRMGNAHLQLLLLKRSLRNGAMVWAGKSTVDVLLIRAMKRKPHLSWGVSLLKVVQSEGNGKLALATVTATLSQALTAIALDRLPGKGKVALSDHSKFVLSAGVSTLLGQQWLRDGSEVALTLFLHGVDAIVVRYMQKRMHMRVSSVAMVMVDASLYFLGAAAILRAFFHHSQALDRNYRLFLFDLCGLTPHVMETLALSQQQCSGNAAGENTLTGCPYPHPNRSCNQHAWIQMKVTARKMAPLYGTMAVIAFMMDSLQLQRQLQTFSSSSRMGWKALQSAGRNILFLSLTVGVTLRCWCFLRHRMADYDTARQLTLAALPATCLLLLLQPPRSRHSLCLFVVRQWLQIMGGINDGGGGGELKRVEQAAMSVCGAMGLAVGLREGQQVWGGELLRRVWGVNLR
jgi:hypothetical protein